MGAALRNTGVNALILELSHHFFTETNAPRVELQQIVHPNNALYLVFTSGSTGRPKGVLNTHACYASSALPRGPLMKRNSQSRVLQFASYSFDMSVDDILLTLMTGGCICVVSDEERSGDISGAIKRMKINHAHLTPSYVDTLDPMSLGGLEVLCLLGEAMTTSNVKNFANRLTLINTYGPSEAAVVTTVTGIINPNSDPCNIGFAQGSRAWVVDVNDHNRLAPIGVPGELLIEGPILARGYLNNLIKTDAAFIRHPTWSTTRMAMDPHTTFYKTGDVVQYANNGSIKFLGRKDSQVKLRGHRIELGEIEYHLGKAVPSQCEVAVDAVALKKKKSTKSNLVLAAFISNLPDQLLAADSAATAPKVVPITEAVRTMFLEAQQKLRSFLPPYMMPHVYIPLGTLPFTISGKRDRKVLKQMASELNISDFELSDSERTGICKKPTTAVEEEMLYIWADVLKIAPEEISITDSFIMLGGDSLDSIRVVVKSASAGFQVTSADILRAASLQILAAKIQISTASPTEIEDVKRFELLKSDNEKELAFATIHDISNIPRENISDIYPVTSIQEDLMMITMRSPDSYTAVFQYQLSDDVDLASLREAWETVHSKTDILRTRIFHHDRLGSFQAVVDEPLQWETAFSVEDFRHRLSFNLGQRLSRLAVVQEGANKTLIWSMHHSIYDEKSLNIILQLVFAAYCGRPVLQPPQFASFIKLVQEANNEESRDFWKGYLDNCPESNFPPPKGDMNNGQPRGIYESAFPLKTSTQSAKVPLAILVRAAWAFVVSHYESSSDVMFGATLNGRGALPSQLLDVVGPTITTLPIRVHVRRDMQVSQYLKTVQEESAAMMPHEQIDIREIRAINDRGAKFRSLLIVQSSLPSLELNTGGGSHSTKSHPMREIVDDTPEPFHSHGIIVACFLRDDEIGISIEFDGNLVTDHKAQNIAKALQLAIISLSTADAAQTLGDINISCSNSGPAQVANLRPADNSGNLSQLASNNNHASSEEISKIWSWNSHVPAVVNKTLHNLIEEQVKRRPDAVALNAWDGNMTYSELYDQASQLAHYLTGLGVGPGVLVPLCFEKSRWYIVAVLAVLKAGGAYVPLDPSQAASRRENILEQTMARIVLTSDNYASELKGLGRTVVGVSSNTIKDLPKPTSSKYAPQHDDATLTAYVFFTSGSTGHPKGTILNHRSVSTSCIHQGRRLGFHEGLRAFQFTAHTFDVSNAEILTTLIHGACVCVPSAEDRFSEECMNRMGITFATLTPSVANLLNPTLIPSLHTIVLGGENVTETDVMKWAHLSRVINGYGPTECAIYCQFHDMEVGKGHSSNIGKAVGAVSWVADPDDYNRLARIGSVGELLVEGHTVALGYLNDPHKTTAAFIQDPAWLTQGAIGHEGRRGRLYRTGDLVRYNDDGTIVYVGRKDTQVKIHGQRVELGEIEHQVQACIPETRQVIVEVATRADEKTPPVLLAFLVADKVPEGSSVTNLDSDLGGSGRPDEQMPLRLLSLPSSTEDALKERLPTYMIPSLYLIIEKIPTNASGKTDRRKLREIGVSIANQQFAESQNVALVDVKVAPPSTDTEMAMRSIWATVLNKDETLIGLEQNFFKLGGDSIGTIQVVRLAREIGVEMKVMDLYKTPTLSGLSSAIEAKQARESCDKEDPAYSAKLTLDQERNGDEHLVAYAASQMAISYDNIESVGPTTYFQHMAVACGLLDTRGYSNYVLLDFKEMLQTSAVSAALESLLQAYPILRTVFIPFKTEVHQAIVKSKTIELETLRIQTSATLDSTGSWWIEQDMRKPSVLTKPLLRGAVIQVQETTQTRVILQLSHALYDGTCLPALLADFKAALQQTELPSQASFIDFANEVCHQQITRPALDFWTNLLKGSRMTSMIPKSAPSIDNILGNTVSRCIEYKPVQEDGTSFATVLQTAWALVLSQLTGQDDVVFGHLVSGRNSLHSVAGACINVVPVRAKVTGGSIPVSELCGQLRDQYIAALPFETVGLGTIVEKCTNWPKWSTFSTIVQHQSLESKTADGIDQSYKLFPPDHDACDVWVISMPSSDQTKIHFNFCRDRIPVTVADQMLDMFIKTIHHLTTQPDLPISGLFEQDTIAAETKEWIAERQENEKQLAVTANCNSKEETAAIPKVVHDAWAYVLEAPDGSKPFFEVSGRPIVAAELQQYYHTRGYAVAISDIFAYPTKAAQAKLVSRMG